MAKKKGAKLNRGVFEKKGYFYANIDGRREYFGAGDEGRKLAEAARAKFELSKYENREIRAGLNVKKTSVKTFRELCNWYMALPSIQAMKIYQRRVYLAAHLLEFFGDIRLANLTVDHQERYRQKREAEGAASGSIDLEINLFSAIFNLGAKRKEIPADLVPGEIIRKGEVNPRQIVTEENFNALLAQCSGDLADFLICGYETAMRINEIAELTPSQVRLDLQHFSGAVLDYIDLGIFDTKTGARRTVPVSARLKAILTRRMAGLGDDDRIFTNGRGHRYTSSLMAMVLRVACEKAGIPYGDKAVDAKGYKIGFVFHCLRHTRTTAWVMAGYSDEIIRRATGHATLAAYQKYIKLDPFAVMRLVDDGTEKGEKRDKMSRNAYQ